METKNEVAQTRLMRRRPAVIPHEESKSDGIANAPLYNPGIREALSRVPAIGGLARLCMRVPLGQSYMEIQHDGQKKNPRTQRTEQHKKMRLRK